MLNSLRAVGTTMGTDNNNLGGLNFGRYERWSLLKVCLGEMLFIVLRVLLGKSVSHICVVLKKFQRVVLKRLARDPDTSNT